VQIDGSSPTYDEKKEYERDEGDVQVEHYEKNLQFTVYNSQLIYSLQFTMGFKMRRLTIGERLMTDD
jgi:hypothetical protein